MNFKCSFCGVVSEKRMTRGLCESHYRRWVRHGDPAGVQIRKGDRLKTLETVLAYEGDECFIWPHSRQDGGYATVMIEGKHVGVHAHVCERTHGPRPSPKHHAAHSCGKGKCGCVTKAHLRWATPAENCADKNAHGTAVFGERHPHSKLTEDDVRRIRSFGPGVTQQEIGTMFNVSKYAVWSIVNRHTWRHVE